MIAFLLFRGDAGGPFGIWSLHDEINPPFAITPAFSPVFALHGFAAPTHAPGTGVSAFPSSNSRTHDASPL